MPELRKIPQLKNASSEVSAIISKLNVAEKDKTNNLSSFTYDLPDISGSIKDKIINNENITQLFPDVELSIQILTSSILAPNEMTASSLSFEAPEVRLPNDIKITLVNSIANYLKEECGIEEKLDTILREALFTKGGYAEYIIPEAAIDEIINSDIYASNGEVSIESYMNESDKLYNNAHAGKTYLGNIIENKIEISLEAYSDNNAKQDIKISIEDSLLNVDITENIGHLVIADRVVDKINKKMVSLESTKDTKSKVDQYLENLFRVPEYNTDEPMVTVKADDQTARASLSKPLVQKLPIESIIPIHVVGDPTKHIGYFILLDDKGAPITNVKKALDALDDFNITVSGGTGSNKQNLINKAKTALMGITKKDPTLNDIEKIYTLAITDRIKRKLKSGVYGDLVDINEDGDIYRVMLSRSLQEKKTKLLFLPKELVAYYAFDYRENGTGKSLLEKVAMLFSIRSILLFSSVMAHLKNSVTTTEVKAELSENDTDPSKSMEKIMSEVMKTRQTQLPLGVTKIDDLVDWVHKVGFKFKFSHPKIPEISIETSDGATSKVIPDTELSDKIQEHIIMSFGLTPDIVKSGYDPEFATTVVAKNILLAKRVIKYQDKFIPQVTNHSRKLLINDPIIKNKIAKIVKDNLTPIRNYLKKYEDELKNTVLDTNTDKQEEENNGEVNIDAPISTDVKVENASLVKTEASINNSETNIDENEKFEIPDDKIVEFITDKFIYGINAKLPRPVLEENTSMKDSLDGYIEAIDKYLANVMSREALPESIAGAMTDRLDDIKAIIKTIMIKKWTADNNYLPEISEFLTIDDEGNSTFNLFDDFSNYLQTLSGIYLPFAKKHSKEVDKIDEKINKIVDETNQDDMNDNQDITGEQSTDENTIPEDENVKDEESKTEDENTLKEDDDIFKEDEVITDDTEQTEVKKEEELNKEKSPMSDM